ncbi:MAG: type II toxin-antitoxin system RelE/ParE family toxin [Acetobacter sp.]|nr:type II toxin-antitoxin system RelE/ParE family toxin [Acetobacter sp.]MBO7072933.1 type II toxin-antitoxin system RelE/ParE family toxin [Acetobacter sp.]
MPQVIFTSGALQDIKYCRRVLELKSPEAAFRSQQVIQQRFLLLETTPLIGRVFLSSHKLELRELIIPFGNSGYIALYRYEPEKELVFILAFRHQKEFSYRRRLL